MVLSQTVQWLNNAPFDCPTIGQCCSIMVSTVFFCRKSQRLMCFPSDNMVLKTSLLDSFKTFWPLSTHGLYLSLYPWPYPWPYPRLIPMAFTHAHTLASASTKQWPLPMPLPRPLPLPSHGLYPYPQPLALSHVPCLHLHQRLIPMVYTHGIYHGLYLWPYPWPLPTAYAHGL